MVPETFLVDTMYHADRFANVEPCLHPRYESHLVMMDNLLMYCWILLARILLINSRRIL